MEDATRVLFEVEDRPFIPTWMGNDEAENEQKIVIWYRSFPQVEQSKYRRMAFALKRKGAELSNMKDMDDAHADKIDEVANETRRVSREAFKRITRLCKGLPGSGGHYATDNEEIAATLLQDDDLANEITLAIATGAVSGPDVVFSEWLSNGQPMVSAG
jgi:hypothetical protein